MPCASRLRGILPVVFLAHLAGCDRVVPTATNLVAIDANPLFVSTGSTNVPETSVIRVADFTFSPNYVTVKQGGSIVWEFEGPKGHTATGQAPTTFNSGNARPGAIFTATLTAAGGYSFYCAPHRSTMTGRVEVPMVIEPSLATPGTPVTITWATVTAPSGYAYDIQVREPGAAAFRDWRINQTVPGITTTSITRLGSYRFKARLRRRSDNVATSWSPEAPLTVATSGVGTVADFHLSCDGMQCSYTDGSVGSSALTAWQWVLGDGVTAQTQNASRTYATEVSRNIQLTATSVTGSQTFGRQVRPTNHVPRSLLSFSCSGLTCDFTDASFDLDGTLTGWSWTFGDGNTSTTQNPQHTYAGQGSYSVQLAATDNVGRGGVPDTLLLFVSPDNVGPVAKFTYACDGLTCTFTDQSFDTDGTIVSWLWELGDVKSTEQNPTYAFPGPTTFWVNLKVTDDKGAQSSPFRKELKF